VDRQGPASRCFRLRLRGLGRPARFVFFHSRHGDSSSAPNDGDGKQGPPRQTAGDPVTNRSVYRAGPARWRHARSAVPHRPGDVAGTHAPQ
jgi:hypothetical protein